MDNRLNKEFRTIILIVAHVLFGLLCISVCSILGIHAIWYMLSFYAIYTILNLIYVYIFSIAHRSFTSKARHFYYEHNKNYIESIKNKRYRNTFTAILKILSSIIFFPAVLIIIPCCITDEEINEADECHRQHSRESSERKDYYYDQYGREKLKFHCPFTDGDNCDAYACCYLCKEFSSVDNDQRIFNDFS